MYGRTDRVIPIYPPNFACGGYTEGSKLDLWAQISLKGIGAIMQEEFEDTKDVFRIRISKKNRLSKFFPRENNVDI